eukprot:6183150-Pleurochrysis_carterae.AAC.1
MCSFNVCSGRMDPGHKASRFQCLTHGVLAARQLADASAHAVLLNLAVNAAPALGNQWNLPALPGIRSGVTDPNLTRRSTETRTLLTFKSDPPRATPSPSSDWYVRTLRHLKGSRLWAKARGSQGMRTHRDLFYQLGQDVLSAKDDGNF